MLTSSSCQQNTASQPYASVHDSTRHNGRQFTYWHKLQWIFSTSLTVGSPRCACLRQRGTPSSAAPDAGSVRDLQFFSSRQAHSFCVKTNKGLTAPLHVLSDFTSEPQCRSSTSPNAALDNMIFIALLYTLGRIPPSVNGALSSL